MNPLLIQFLSEARELLEQASDTFLQLENDVENPELLNQLFRYIHTIKGASGLFDIAAFTELVHVAEDALSKAREGDLTIQSDSIDVFFEVTDLLADWLEQLEQRQALDAGAMAESARLIKKLEARVLNVEHLNGAVSDIENTETQDCLNLAQALASTKAEALTAELALQPQNVTQQGVLIVFRPAENCFFCGDDPLNYWSQVPQLHWQKITMLGQQDNAGESLAKLTTEQLAAFDLYNCQLEFYGISTASITELEQSLQYVLDNVAFVAFETDLQSDEKSEVIDGKSLINSDSESGALLHIIDVQLAALNDIFNSENPEATLSAIHHVLKNAEMILGIETGFIGDIDDTPLDQELVSILIKAFETLKSSSQLHAKVPVENLEAQVAPAEMLDIKDSETVKNKVSEDLNKPVAIKTLKVDQERVEQLVDLTGELIVAKNSMQHLSRRVEKEYGIKTLSREIKSEYAVLNRITESLQGVVMQIRMIPVSTIFQRFPRLIRDLSRKLGKQIELVVDGEETEADKNIVEQLSDPLIHLVRNSIDHGIESPEVRQAAGKSPSGKIYLSAKTVEDTVQIDIRDDGQGIDAQVIKNKAVAKGVLTAEAAESLSDEDALNLIFEPGFSTKEEVSELSGRGVGMDVVRTVVNSIGGTIELQSEVGQGSLVRVILPASITVTRVMMFELENQVYGVPVDDLIETIKIQKAEIKQIKDRNAIVRRGQLTPLYSMNSLLNVPSTLASGDDIPVLNMNINGHFVGLSVDKLLEGVDVIIKPLEGVMARFPIYSGAAVLGDGRVLLVINLKEINLCQS